jgi:phthalate 4,5-cis-dihydrodiol dehydrogenase
MSATTRVGLGIIGLGRGFVLTLPALTGSPDVQLVGAFDVRAEARSRFASEFNAKDYGSLDELLSDQNVQAVYIATPQELHARQTIAAAEAGKHILVEKPMATSVAECAAMIRAAERAGVVLLVGPSHGFDAQVQRAAELIGAGTFGAIRMVTALNFTDYVYRPRRPEELDPAKGGGVVFSQACHQIDVVRRLVDRPITEIMAVAGNWDSARQGDGAYTALLKFANGTAASITYSGYAHYDSDELMDWISELGRKKDPDLYGQARRSLSGLSPQEEIRAKVARTFGGAAGAVASPGAVRHNEHFGFVIASCEHADLKIISDGIWVFADAKREFLPVLPPSVPRAPVIEELISAVRGERPPRYDGKWGLATTQCCAALVRSSATGEPVMFADMKPDDLDTIRS